MPEKKDNRSEELLRGLVFQCVLRILQPLLFDDFDVVCTDRSLQMTGFSLNKAEQRCGICGALGHLGPSAASQVSDSCRILPHVFRQIPQLFWFARSMGCRP